MKWRSVLFLTAVFSLALCCTACQYSPQKDVITSKNDGTFDANSAISSNEHHESDSVMQFDYSNEFLSTDGNVEFQVNIDTCISNADMPIAEVSPHFLTGAECKKIAEIFLGDAVFYEKDQVLSQGEIQQCLQRWIPYTDRDAMRDLLPPTGESTIDWRIELLKKSVKAYSEAYESAPVENPHKLCEWVFRQDSYYSPILAEESSRNAYEENQSIQAIAYVNEIPYYFYASIRDSEDFKLSSLYMYPVEYALGDKAMYIAELCRTEKPNNAQIEKIKTKADDMLKKMNLGEWQVDECYIETTERNEHIVHVNAVPKIQNVAVLRMPQLNNLKSKAVFASNYYLTDARFRFTPNGDLLYFELQSPVDINQIVNDNVSVYPISELLESAKNTLSLSDIYAYDFNAIVDLCKEQQIELGCSVEINGLEYNLVRVKKPNTDASYYFVPGIILSGTIEYYNKATDELICCLEQRQLLAMNAVDGSIIPISNE
ncbi:MAG: DUF6034 family protein [Eubacteriales bacterium]|nr:DUF6034 family protein [Eubacteriales bacterium]